MYEIQACGHVCERRRVISLDIDGVLHDANMVKTADICALAIGGGAVLRSAGLFAHAQLLEGLLGELGATDVRIIIHSSWRKHHWAPGVIRAALGPLERRFESMTSPDAGREASVEALCARAGIDDYLIIDDAHDEFTPGNPHLVVTNPIRGLNDPAVLARIRAWVLRDTSFALAS
jgi:hypothetical protein